MSGDSDASLPGSGTWVVDPAHSRVGFAVTFMGISTVRGAGDVGDVHARLGSVARADGRPTCGVYR
jgi:hypothetical protein